MRFVDEATITVRSGKGGHGCASFRRERFIPRGGPDGGDGGKGGDIVIRATDKLLTLYDFRLKRLYQAKNGLPGMGKDRYGKSADDLILELPVGTILYEITENDDGTETENFYADLLEVGDEVRVCKGGDGGRGNIHFKTSTNQAPRRSEEGFPGEEKRLRLELKILADVGLLGLPNAGKSTFLSAISSARPKIASYPFTTLTPNLGVIEDDYCNRLVIADIPGLIEGASQGHGLGHTFLKHVERTRFLVHILSCEDINLDDPMAGFALLNDELAEFDQELGLKDQIKVINKIDTLDEEAFQSLKAAIAETGQEVFFISALEGIEVEELLETIWAKFNALDSSPNDTVNSDS